MKQKAGHIDLMIFLSVVALMLFSVAIVYSASASVSQHLFAGDPSAVFRSHMIRVGLGLVTLFLGMKIDYHRYQNASKYLLLVGLGLLAYTLVAGTTIKGAQRWVSFGFIQFQPSEFAKYALVIHLAVLLAQKQKYIGDLKNGFLPLMVWIVAVVALVFLQPNFSTGLIILSISFLLLFIGRVRVKYLLGTVAAGIPILLVYAVSAQYRWNRIMAFVTGNTDGLSKKAEAAKYQIEQAVIGLGNGGLFGVGPGLSKQRELFLPESYTDFIYAIVGEEYGLVGASFLLAVFALILIRGIKTAKHAPDELGRFMAFGITITIAMYAMINAMVTTGIVPTTGLPLPLISYGGTSILFTSFACGVLLNISTFTRIRPRGMTVDAPSNGPRAGELYQ